jgi:hypothetical protein
MIDVQHQTDHEQRNPHSATHGAECHYSSSQDCSPPNEVTCRKQAHHDGHVCCGTDGANDLDVLDVPGAKFGRVWRLQIQTKTVPVTVNQNLRLEIERHAVPAISSRNDEREAPLLLPAVRLTTGSKRHEVAHGSCSENQP